VHGGADRLGHAVGAGGLGAGQQDDEFPRRPARREVAGAAQGSGNGVRHHTQAFVAGGVAIGVVVFLEVVDIDHGDGDRRADALGMAQLLQQHGIEAAAVGQAGQAILHGPRFELLVGGAELLLELDAGGDVAGDDDEALAARQAAGRCFPARRRGRPCAARGR